MSFPLIHPEDYFSGESWSEPLPEEVLLFTRNSRRSLDGRHVPENRPVHHHSRYNLIIALEGGCRILLDREAVPLPPGGAMLIHPWQTFRFLYDEDKPIKWLFFGFDWPGRRAPLCRGEVRLLSTSSRMLCEFALERRLGDGPGPWLVPLLVLLLQELPRLSLQAAGAVPLLKGEDSLVLKVQKILLDNLPRALTIGEIAGLCAYSESRLRHIFQYHAGTSLGSYIRQIRLNEAARLLCQSEFSVSAVAEKCGYSSVYVFSRGFKTVFGLPPLHYRRRFGGNRP